MSRGDRGIERTRIIVPRRRSCDPRARGRWDGVRTRILPWILSLLAVAGGVARAQSEGAVTLLDPSGRAIEDATVRDSALAAVTDLAPVFGLDPGPAFRIVVHADASTIAAELRNELSPRAAGFALRGRDEIHLVRDRMRPPSAPLDAVVRHEVVHVLLDRFAGPRRSRFVPRWVHEGLAQQLADHGWLGTSEDILFLPARGGSLLRFVDLRARFPLDERESILAYAQSRSFVAWLERHVGREILLAAIRDLRGPDDFPRALARVGGGAMVDHEVAWVDYLRNGSGAGLRFVANNCFAYVGILAFVLLAAAAGRHYAREAKIRARLERADEIDQEHGEARDSLPDAHDPHRGPHGSSPR
jgi:hypothetical protein